MKWIKKITTTPLTTLARVINSVSGNSTTDAPSVYAVKTALADKQDALNFDNTPTDGSSNPVTSTGIYNYLHNELVDMLYPVGSIYMTVNGSINPGNIIGGSWVQISGYYLYGGARSAAGTYGGSATTTITPTGTVGPHTLTVDEIPSHTHTFGMTNGLTYSNLGVTSGGSSVGTGLNQSGAGTGLTGGGNAHDHNFEADSIDISIAPQRLNVVVWKRIV